MSQYDDDIKRYREGLMSKAEQHRFEKKALEDPFLADALEGAGNISDASFAQDVDELHLRITPAKPLFTPMRIAAAVLLFVAVGGAIFLLTPPIAQPIAMEQQPQAPGKGPTEKNDLSLNEAIQTKEEKASASGSTPPKLEKEKKTTHEANEISTSQPQDQIGVTESLADTQGGARTLKSEAEPEEITTRKAEQSYSRSAVPSRLVVTGMVVAQEDGTPIPGVNVSIKGSGGGTVTDIHGEFKIPVASEDQPLVFTFVGLQTREVTAGPQPMKVAMNEDVSQLSEVVIQGKAVDANAMHEPVVKLAAPVGGLKAYNDYLERELQYPREALDQKIKGKVTIQFVVTTGGELTDFSVVRSLGHGCDEEVIRLVKEGPRWSPSTEDDVPVESEVRVKMKFDPAKAGK